MELTQENVSRIFRECLCKNGLGENANTHIVVDHGDIKHHLDQNCVENNKKDINSLILQIQTYERTNKHSETEHFHIIIDMSRNDEDARWTENNAVIRQLKILGLATGILMPCEGLQCEHFFLKI